MIRRATIHKLSFFLVLSILALELKAQDVESLKDAKPVQVSGGWNYTTMFTESNDPNNQRDPFFWQFAANINFNFFGVINAPFTATFNNQESTTTQPALPTQIGISPSYKMYTAHLGWRSMNLSKYSLGGQTFLGVGAEIKPKEYWLSGAAMYGRLQQPIQPIRGQDPGTYTRRGYGFKLTAGQRDQISLVVFRARDDENSILLDSLAGDIAPKENLVWSLAGKKQITNQLSVQVEFAQSALTQDTRNTDRVLNDNTYFNNLGRLFTPNATTQIKGAFEGSVNYKLKIAQFSFGYMRVAPEYETLGTQAINNDLEEIKGGVSWQMFRRKVSIGTNVGVQRNNLDNSLATGVKKVATAANISWMATDKLNFTTSYSNFNTQSLQRRTPNLQPVDIQLDTLEFFQVTENATFTTSYRFGNENKQQNLTLSTNYQTANDSESNNNDAFNGNMAYALTFIPIRLTVSSSYNYNITNSNAMEFVAHGPTLAGSMPVIRETVTLTLALTRLSSIMDGELNSIVSNINFGARYSLKKKHNFSFTALSSNRQSRGDESTNITENRLNFQYAYSF